MYILRNRARELKMYDFKSSLQRCSLRKGVLRNVAKFTGKHFYQKLVKLQG